MHEAWVEYPLHQLTVISSVSIRQLGQNIQFLLAYNVTLTPKLALHLSVCGMIYPVRGVFWPQ